MLASIATRAPASQDQLTRIPSAVLVLLGLTVLPDPLHQMHAARVDIVTALVQQICKWKAINVQLDIFAIQIQRLLLLRMTLVIFDFVQPDFSVLQGRIRKSHVHLVHLVLHPFLAYELKVNA